MPKIKKKYKKFGIYINIVLIYSFNKIIHILLNKVKSRLLSGKNLILFSSIFTLCNLCIYSLSNAQNVDTVYVATLQSGGEIVTIISFIVAFISILAGIITIIWFIKDSRKENSKVLKRQEQILIKIEEGQRIGFDNQIKSLENIQKSLEIQTKILAKIEARD